jgi:hypothetical protein
MIVDIDRVRHFVSIEIQRWIERHGADEKIKIVESTVASCMSPTLETAYLVEELTGPDDNLTQFINRVSLWYGVTEVQGRRPEINTDCISKCTNRVNCNLNCTKETKNEI